MVKARNQEYLIAFGQNLRKLIDKHNLTPETVASRGEIETKQVYRVIHGEHSATLSIIYAIAKGLDVKPKILFDFEFND